MKKKLISWLIAFVFLLAPISPVANATQEVCVGSECSVEFTYTGTVQSWSPPTNAENFRFEIYGASGGRGGLGGAVTGDLKNLPGTIYIAVGGEGIVGASAAGGFNGGGDAGGSRGNEGSGGGATDIRLTPNTDSRILVAGGGGGAGGYAGGNGGAGGGLVAASGDSGQGGGGSGGTQSSGGIRGSSNGGTTGSNGQFITGGYGGTSWNAGGGGGGGGWYGGGGGGADDDACCSDGGGGGGGSSYASTTYTASVVHNQGVQTGNGRLVIYYSLPANVTSGTASQLDSQTAQFTFSANLNFSAVTSENFTLEGTDCQLGEILSDLSALTVTVTGCETGLVTLTLKQRSLFSQTAPTSDLIQNLEFDATGPSANWQVPGGTFTSNSIELVLETSDETNVLTETDFLVTGCSLLNVEKVDSYRLRLGDCLDGDGEIRLLAQSLEDPFGNLSPASDLALSFVVDTVAPTATFQSPIIEGEDPFLISVVLDFSEPVQFDPAILQQLVPVGCEFTPIEIELGYQWNSNCSYGEFALVLPAESLQDVAGNLGPSENLMLSFSHSKPEEVVIPTAPEDLPEPSPVPTQQPNLEPSLEPGPEPSPDPVKSVEILPAPIESAPDMTPPSDEPTQDSVNLIEAIEQLLEPVPEVPNEPTPEMVTSTPETLIDQAPEQPVTDPAVTDSIEALPEESFAQLPPSELENQLVLANNSIAEEPEGDAPVWIFVSFAAVLGVLGFALYRFIGR